MNDMQWDRRAFLAAAASAPMAASTVAAATSTTSAWQVGKAGDFDTLELVERQLPPPGPGEVLIDVDASAIAGRDLAIARGWFLEDKPPELVPLSEGVGRIAAVGDGVTRVKVGDRVVSTHFARWVSGPWSPDNYVADVGNTIDGWLAKRIVLPESGIAVVPAELTDSTAATLAGSGVTVWHALYEVARVKSGDVVLSLGTGGVSSWGVLLAKAAGATVVVTSSSDAKLERMKTLGADITVNYRRNPNWGEEVMARTGTGANVVLENVGRETLDQSMLACANNAMIVMIGTARLPDELPKMPGFYIKNLSLKAISNGSRLMLEDMMRGVAASGIQAVVEQSFDFADAVQAFQFMAQSSHIGKVVVRH